MYEIQFVANNVSYQTSGHPFISTDADGIVTYYTHEFYSLFPHSLYFCVKLVQLLLSLYVSHFTIVIAVLKVFLENTCTCIGMAGLCCDDDK